MPVDSRVPGGVLVVSATYLAMQIARDWREGSAGRPGVNGVIARARRKLLGLRLAVVGWWILAVVLYLLHTASWVWYPLFGVGALLFLSVAVTSARLSRARRLNS